MFNPWADPVDDEGRGRLPVMLKEVVGILK